MAKGHKKFLRSEKAKVKLKKLPKGLNVTKTEFKIKKIIIKDQLGEICEQDGRKKQNIKEVLSRLRHHNDSFRMEALRNLKVFISSSVLDEVFKDLIQGISSMCLDVDRDIRRESFKVFTMLLSLTDFIAVKPFFPIISSYLTCAMTHLQQTIQEDSLLLLDVLILHTPDLVALNSDKIFGNFLDMISKLRNDSKPGRTLTANINSKTTTIKWRSKILDRLQQMIQIIKLDLIKRTQRLECSEKTRSLSVQSECISFPILFGQIEKKCDLNEIFNKSIYKNEVNDFDEGEKFQRYIKSLLPLLIESWLEVKPSVKDSDGFKLTEFILTSEGSCTLFLILSISKDLWELTEMWEQKVNRGTYLTSWFKSEFSSNFTVHILDHFPYQQEKFTKAKQRKDNKDLIGNLNCTVQNLLISYMFSVLNSKKMTADSNNSSKILSYVETCLINNINATESNISSILEQTLELILHTNGNWYLSVNEFETKKILKILINEFQTGKVNRNSKSNILKLLCNIVLSHKLHLKYGSDIFENWLSTLPNMLQQQMISEHSLITLSNLGKQKNVIFLNALKNSVEKAIENISSIQVNGSSNLYEGRKSIMNLFYWIDYWEPETFQFLVRKIKSEIIDKDLSEYFIFIITSRSEPQNV